MRTRLFLVLAAILCLMPRPAGAVELSWQPWTGDLFTRAKAEGRFVILDLEAVWCHWCHVMEQTTYANPRVAELLESKYITVRVDQDANPDLSSRYGNWGWPATIIFAPDGSELAKRRGFIPPENMISLLEAVIADPTPGPSVAEEVEVTPAESAFVPAETRAKLVHRLDAAYDSTRGGWGSVHKYIDPEAMDWTLAAAERGDAGATAKARQTLDAALALLDRQWGGIYQYSDAVDWSSPHYEKIMSFQASGLRHYADAYALWGDPSYRAAAENLARFLTTLMLSPEGAFYTSQDADLDEAMHGKAFYALSATEREKLGRMPRIDKAIYARENGWAISGLVAYANATGDVQALDAALKAANWVIAHRMLAGGGFAHGANDRGGPYIGDTLSMGDAALDLYAATGDRRWLDVARGAGDFLASRFKDETGGFLSTLAAETGAGVFMKPVKPLEEQVAATRFANRLHRYLGRDGDRALAEHGMRYLASPAILDLDRPLAGVLAASAETAADPAHITIVGRKDDASAQALHRAARAYPALYKRLDWWDTREGPLPNPDVQYPELDQAAAFACANRICSLPVLEPGQIGETVRQMLSVRTGAAER